jgi:protoporphyrinogen oxidase
MRNKEHPNIAILGGGPAGLAAAYELAKVNRSPVLFEKANLLGGIARTENWNDYYFDLGGHRFFTKSEEINTLWHEILSKEEFLTRPRLSRIYYNKKFFNYPLKPFNALFGLGGFESSRILFSYMKSKLFASQKENNFEEWIINRFGKRLYEIFFKAYTEKVWGIPCTEISAEWAAQRIKGLTLTSAVINAILGSKKNNIKTLINEFEYPKNGPGLMWAKMAGKIEKLGGKIRLNSDVSKVGFRNNAIEWIEINNQEKFEVDNVISSLPLRDLILRLSPAPDSAVLKAAELLPYRELITVALVIDKAEIFPDNWIYIHSPDVYLGRIQNFKNWSPYMVPDKTKTCLGMEYFSFEGDFLWKMKDEDLIKLASDELVKVGLLRSKEKILSGKVIRTSKAYPSYTNNYKENLKTIIQFLKNIRNFQSIGRNGMHRYNNMDHSMLTGIYAARNIFGSNYNLWKINADEEYHEEN